MNLIESIYNEPENWKPGKHWFTHKNGARLWVSNGWSFCNPEGAKFGILNKIRAYRAYKWWCINAPVEALSCGQ